MCSVLESILYHPPKWSSNLSLYASLDRTLPALQETHVTLYQLCLLGSSGPAAGSRFPHAFSHFSPYFYAPAEGCCFLMAQLLILNLLSIYYKPGFVYTEIDQMDPGFQGARSLQTAIYPTVLKYGTLEKVAAALLWD